ncbi:MAG: hypothetical protein ABIQ39_06350 [Ilumatobacteraceae bacterium]
MSAAVIQPSEVDESSGITTAPVSVVALKRRTIDLVLIAFGVVATVVFSVAGGLLTWGSSFANDYVHNELSSQHISFPDAATLTAEKRPDLLKFAGRSVDSGSAAQGYASYINGHLAGVAGGSTYADLSGPQTAANAAVKAAVAANEPQPAVDALKAKADAITGQRTTLFTGETLRGLLLTAYAWSTVGRIAGYAAIGAFVASGLMLILVVIGVIRFPRVRRT